MKETNLIRVTSVSDELKDKNERTYKSVEFSNPEKVTVVDESTGEVVTVRQDPKRCKVNRYQENYLNGREDFLFDANVGERTPGMVVTQLVEPYEINNERIVDSYTAVIFGNSNSPLFKNQIRNAFANQNHPLKKVLSEEDMEQLRSVTIEEMEKSEQEEPENKEKAIAEPKVEDVNIPEQAPEPEPEAEPVVEKVKTATIPIEPVDVEEESPAFERVGEAAQPEAVVEETNLPVPSVVSKTEETAEETVEETVAEVVDAPLPDPVPQPEALNIVNGGAIPDPNGGLKF